MQTRCGGGIGGRAAKIIALWAALGAIASSCTCEPSGGRAQTTASASAAASPPPAATAPAQAPGAPSSSASAGAGAAPVRFVRERPEERNGADACAYLG